MMHETRETRELAPSKLIRVETLAGCFIYTYIYILLLFLHTYQTAVQ